MTDCIINVGIGHWYPKGSERLHRSLIYHGYHGDILIWKDTLPEGSPTHEENPYAMKIYAFQYAIDQGYTNILWLDSSVWCIRYPRIHIEAMGREGYYLFSSGDFSCAQWTNDNCLDYFGITREEGKDIPMLASGVLGLNMDTEIAREFFAQWKNAMLAGAFKGSWQDHRHDQSAASIIAHRLGMRQHAHQLHEYYYQPAMPETAEFALAGM
jgi:hypothetical protein